MDSPVDPYRRLVESFPAGIVFLFDEDENGTLRYTLAEGEGFEDIMLTPADVSGNPVADGRPPEVRERIVDHYRRALDGEEITLDVEAEGRSYSIKLFPVYDDDGDVVSGAAIAQDVTERAAYREELERQNERLESLARAISHDLRNPLTVAMQYLELLRDECDSEHIDTIADALERMEALTDDIVESGANYGGVDGEAVTLADVAASAWENVATGEADLVVDGDLAFEAEPSALRRLFENLFRNAVEHGSTHSQNAEPSGDAAEPGGSDVTVRVGPLEEGFYVEDDGVGIPESDREGLFERGTTGSEDGNGLGLYIIGNIVDAHGWDIELTESEAGGARFEVSGITTGTDDESDAADTDPRR